jgi:CRP-like cAMP-binding protein
MTPDELLERVLPFQFLSEARRLDLRERLDRREYDAGDILLRHEDTSRDVFILAEGVVEATDDRDPPKILGRILPGHYFGELAALFDQPRELTVRARTDVVAYTLPGKDFLELVEEERVFSQALSHTLRVRNGIFEPYQRLYARLLSLIDTREFLLSDLVEAYRNLHPALHPQMHEEQIDVGALAYAVARLPETVTRTTFYYLVGSLPVLYRNPDSLFERVNTKARRRAGWTPLPGKCLQVVRDGLSDVTDLLTNLCLYVVEAQKIRKRCRSYEVLELLWEVTGDTPPVSPDREQRLLELLPLSPDELNGLRAIWPLEFWSRLRDIILHHEDVGVEADVRVEAYHSRTSEVWVSQIRDRVRDLVDLEDPTLRVHIISSNTHSVANCLSPALARRSAEVLAWGAEHCPHLGRPEDWAEQADLLYVSAREYLRAHPEQRHEWDEEERAAGHHHLSSTAFTGIEVDVFDVRRLDPKLTDPKVQVQSDGSPLLIVNVDYAFGQQAEEILSNLLLLFSSRVRSVSVLGKAGGLTGKRGDMLLPREVLLQTNDELYPLPACDLRAEDLADLSGGRPVHEGPVLTVAGTLLQDRGLLHFYRRIWKCVGLEMEGSFYARELISAISTGVVSRDVRSRFAYYTSDVPLDPDETLSEPLEPWEGVPPLYALTRAVLRKIFSQERDEATRRL